MSNFDASAFDHAWKALARMGFFDPHTGERRAGLATIGLKWEAEHRCKQCDGTRRAAEPLKLCEACEGRGWT